MLRQSDFLLGVLFFACLSLSAEHQCQALPKLKTDKIPVDETADIRGKVTDETNRPQAHVKVHLTDKVTGELITLSTGGDGQFNISTRSKHALAIEFEPPVKSGLAGASYDDLPAGEDRQLFVHLVRGFPVRGKVVYSGRALKGMTVKATPDGAENAHDRINGGGKAVTNGDGNFRMILSPGRKQLVVYNRIYSNVARETKRPISVSADLDLGEIDLLPPVQ